MLNVNDLRETLSEQIQKIRKGEGDIKEAKAISMLSKELCNTYRLEMQYYKTAGKKPEFGTFLPPPAIDVTDDNAHQS